MGFPCPGCGARSEVGLLCRRCAAEVAPCDGLLPDHLTSRTEPAAAAGWLFDGFGGAHALSADRTVVGRQPDSDLVVLASSISRQHAELVRSGDGWQLRDLGSRNGCHVDGRRIQGRAALGERAVLRLGDVAFLFAGRRLDVPAPSPRSIATDYVSDATTVRFTVRGPALHLCLLATRDGDGAGALLYRPAAGDAPWAETSLPPLEFQLLRVLCDRAIAEAGSPARVRGCVPTKQLARDLPFQSRYANEENVRQVVRRVRATLHEIGADGLIEALPGRGYYVAWPVVTT
jgi:hypothetical protein